MTLTLILLLLTCAGWAFGLMLLGLLVWSLSLLLEDRDA